MKNDYLKAIDLLSALAATEPDNDRANDIVFARDMISKALADYTLDHSPAKSLDELFCDLRRVEASVRGAVSNTIDAAIEVAPRGYNGHKHAKQLRTAQLKMEVEHG